MKYPITAERADLLGHKTLIGMEEGIRGTASDSDLRAALGESVRSLEILNTKVIARQPQI